MFCFHLSRPLIWPPASQDRKMLWPLVPVGKDGQGLGQVIWHRHSQGPALMRPALGRDRHLRTLYSFPGTAPCRVGEGTAMHRAAGPPCWQFTCYVYFYAYLLCTAKITRKPLGEKSSSSPLFVQVNEQCVRGSGLSTSPPITREPMGVLWKEWRWSRACLGEGCRAFAQSGCPGSPVGLGPSSPESRSSVLLGLPAVGMTFSRFTHCTTQFITTHFGIFLSTNS